MSDDERALGGYSPEAGRNAHEADAPTLIPVPSLLRSLLSEHLDPGYAGSRRAPRGGEGPQPGRRAGPGRLGGAVAVATVFATAAAQAQSVAPATRETQHVLADGVRAAEQSTRDAIGRRDTLAAQVETAAAQPARGRRAGSQPAG